MQLNSDLPGPAFRRAPQALPRAFAKAAGTPVLQKEVFAQMAS